MGLDIVCTAHTPRAQFGDEEMKAGRQMRNRDSDQMGKRQVGRAYAREDVRSKKTAKWIGYLVATWLSFPLVRS